jgi:site-specific recombinase XerD
MATPHKKRLFRDSKWQNCYDRFILSLRNAGTRTSYEATVRRFFAFVAQKYGSARTPDKVSQADVEDFLSQPTSRKGHDGEAISPFTYNSYLNALRAFYAYCGRETRSFRGKTVPLLKELPTARMKIAKTGDVERDMEEEEVRAFFAAIDTSTIIGKRDFSLFFAAVSTGRRRMELTNLLRGDI